MWLNWRSARLRASRSTVQGPLRALIIARAELHAVYPLWPSQESHVTRKLALDLSNKKKKKIVLVYGLELVASQGTSGIHGQSGS